ncbi:uncharacterized protein LOC141679933 [Apium graveolens]|uniref:uncharacterized protein LOC141679933 n=1 Tax=Apium graveolens TaxID=4045 RepID=UPI003D7A7480
MEVKRLIFFRGKRGEMKGFMIKGTVGATWHPLIGIDLITAAVITTTAIMSQRDFLGEKGGNEKWAVFFPPEQKNPFLVTWRRHTQSNTLSCNRAPSLLSVKTVSISLKFKDESKNKLEIWYLNTQLYCFNLKPRLPNFIPLPSFSLPGGVAFLGWKFIIILSMGWKFIIILSMRNKKLFWVSAAAPLTSDVLKARIELLQRNHG